MDAPDTREFWPFSLALYARPGVAPALIALQDRQALDVNLLLYCCWAGGRGQRLSTADLDRLIAAVQPWHERVVQPLRAARRGAGDFGAAGRALYQRLKDDELAAEEVEQALLSQALTLATGARDTAAVAANLRAYCAARGVCLEEADRDALATVLRACDPTLTPPAALDLLGS